MLNGRVPPRLPGGGLLQGEDGAHQGGPGAGGGGGADQEGSRQLGHIAAGIGL